MDNPYNIDMTKRAAYAALLLLHKDDAYDAATELFPEDATHAMYAAVNWPRDEVVQAEYARLYAEGADLPGKSDLQRAVWGMIQSAQTVDEKLKAAKLYADLGNMIEKPAAVQVNNNANVVVPRMIEAPQMSLSEWEAGCAAQQKESLQHADTRH